jgi:hypothetical protein
MLIHIYNPSTLEEEAGELRVPGKPGLSLGCIERLCLKTKQNGRLQQLLVFGAFLYCYLWVCV